MKEPSAAELDALIDEAIVDAYTEDEQLTGFAVMIEDNPAGQIPLTRNEIARLLSAIPRPAHDASHRLRWSR